MNQLSVKEEPDDEQKADAALENCEHFWIWHNSPKSIPTNFEQCEWCHQLNAQEAITRQCREARYDELALLNDKIAQNGWHGDNQAQMFVYIAEKFATLKKEDTKQ